jgi:hypothetical protein
MGISSITLMLVLSSIAVEPGQGSLGEELCTCLDAEYIATRDEFVRDGTPVFSMLLPKQMKRIDHGRFEGEAVEWLSKNQTITSSYFLRGTTGSSPTKCVLPVPAGKISVTRDQTDTRITIGALFDHVARSQWSSLQLWFSGTDASILCSNATRSLGSLSFLGDWTTLSLVSIARDRKSFVYRDNVGAEHAAGVGSYITRDSGKVTAIHEESIELIDLEEASGSDNPRWLEKTRRIWLTKKAR